MFTFPQILLTIFYLLLKQKPHNVLSMIDVAKEQFLCIEFMKGCKDNYIKSLYLFICVLYVSPSLLFMPCYYFMNFQMLSRKRL